MHVRLSVAWTDPVGAVHAAGDVVDVDAVTLAELEEQGVVEDLDPTATDGGSTSSAPSPQPPKSETDSDTDAGTSGIGPGPGAPPKDDTITN